jgi:hypothetical protein
MTMKQIIITTSLFLIFFGCKKNTDNPIQQSIIIGDYSTDNLTLTDIEPDTIFYGWEMEDSYYIDADDNGINNYQLKIYNNWIQGGLVLANSSIIISSLLKDAYVLLDSLDNPKIFHLNDTLRIDDKWESGDYILFKKTLDSYEPPFDSYSISGIWNNVNESYIGIKLKENQMGWIKVDITPYSIKIYEYAIEK